MCSFNPHLRPHPIIGTRLVMDTHGRRNSPRCSQPGREPGSKSPSQHTRANTPGMQRNTHKSGDRTGGTRGAGATVKTIWKGGGASRAGREHCVLRAPGGRVVTQIAHAQPGATQAGFGLEGRNSSPGLTIPLRQRETSGAYELREDYICIFTNLWDNQTRERGTALASAEGISRRPSGSAPAQRS